MGNWNEADKIEVANLRLAGAAKIFYSGCSDLHEHGVTWQKFKDTFRNRFKDVHRDQFHLICRTPGKGKMRALSISPIAVKR